MNLVEHLPSSAPLTSRLGGSVGVSQIVYCLVERMLCDPMLKALAVDVHIAEPARAPLEGLVRRWAAELGWETHLPMIVGHLAATLAEFSVDSSAAREIVGLVETATQAARAA